MPEDPEDRLQPKKGWSRRDFVKTSIVAGTTGAALGVGAVTVAPLSRIGPRLPKFRYIGVKVLPNSQAPRGIPILPVEVNPAGELVGRPDHLEWYRYCGRSVAPGLNPGFITDNVFRYEVDPKALQTTQAEGIDAWYAGRLGQKARLEDFDELGKGAPVVWRSEGQERTNPLTCLLIRVDPALYPKDLADRFLPAGVLGVFATCAHLCLVPTWRASKVGYGEGHWDDITCFGHGSWYNPRALAEYEFPPTA